jgi:hypothetical protein
MRSAPFVICIYIRGRCLQLRVAISTSAPHSRHGWDGTAPQHPPGYPVRDSLVGIPHGIHHEIPWGSTQGSPQSPGFPRAWAAPPPVDPPTGSPQGNPKVELLWTRQGSKRGVTEATAPPPRASLPMWSPAVGAVVSRCGLLLWAPTVGPHGVHGSQISTHRGPPQKSNPTDTFQALPPKVTTTV